MAFDSVQAILTAAREAQKPLWQVIMEDDLRERGTKPEDSFEQMNSLWLAMKNAAENYDSKLRSASGLSGGDGAKMTKAAAAHKTIGGDFIGEVISEALKMGESNACMRRIVAAPTAGSCGVLPAVLIPLQRREKLSDEQIIQALFVAAGFGQVIASRATIAGAEGGCQAEVGAASAMAAAALTAIKGGTPEMSADACAMALKNLLGLVCDPVAGLVEVPCIKRNVVGAVNAISCADMALARVHSRVPADEVIDAMREISALMPSALKETSGGGLAQTPTGLEIAKKLYHNSSN